MNTFEKSFDNSQQNTPETFSMLFPNAKVALDVPNQDIDDFFDDFIAMNWGDAPVDDFMTKYGKGVRPMNKQEKDDSQKFDIN